MTVPKRVQRRAGRGLPLTAVSLLALITTLANAQFVAKDFPADGPHRRMTDIPNCNRLKIRVCYSYDSPQCPSSAVWHVAAIGPVVIDSWTVSGVPNMPKTGWVGGAGLSFEPNQSRIKWESNANVPPITGPARAHSFNVPGRQRHPVQAVAILPMVITYREAAGAAQQTCKFPVYYPSISEACEPRDCVVNKAVPPQLNCVAACAAIPQAQAFVGATTVISARYATTLTSAAHNGAACPTETSTCACPTQNCQLGAAVATATSGVQPDCNDANGSTRITWGTATTTFAVASPARFGGACTTTATGAVVQDCPCTVAAGAQVVCGACQYAGTSANAQGQYFSTGSSVCTTATRQGCPAATSSLPCSTALAPTNCVQANTPNCPNDFPSCQANNFYPTSVTLTCPYPTVTQAAFGGQPCNRAPLTTTMAFYQESRCACGNFARSETNVVAGTRTATSFGNQVCTSTRNPAAPTGVGCNDAIVNTGAACSTQNVLPDTDGQGGGTGGGGTGGGGTGGGGTGGGTGGGGTGGGGTGGGGTGGGGTGGGGTGGGGTGGGGTGGGGTGGGGTGGGCNLGGGGNSNNGGCGTMSSGGAGYSCGDNAVTCIRSPFNERFQVFNAIFYGNLNKADGGRVEGRLAVRGDAVLNDFSVGDNLLNPNAPCQCVRDDMAELVVGGTLDFQVGRVYGGILIDRTKGSAGISQSVMASLNANCYVRSVDNVLSRIQFDQHQQDMRLLSAHLLTLTPTLSIRWDDNLSGWRIYRVRDSVTTRQEVLTFPQGVASVNIINWQELVSSLLGARTLIVNLPGVAISGMDYEALSGVADRVIWNFGPDATAVTITQVRLYGSVIAPKAVITGTGSIFGQVFAMSTGHSIHLAQFRGCISAIGSGTAGGSTGAPVITQEQIPAPRPRPPAAPQVPAPPATCARMRRYGSFEWNVLVFRDMEQPRSLNVDGRLAVGGSFSAGGMSVGDNLQVQNACQSPSLLLGGEPGTITGRVANGAIGVQTQFISKLPPSACQPIGLSADQLRAQLDFAAAQNYFVALSRALHSLPATMTLQYPGQGSVMPSLVPVIPRPSSCSSDFEVVQLTANDRNIVGFNNWEQVHGLFTAGKTLIINLPPGASLNVGDWSPLPTSRVIWNFGPEASQANIRVPLRGLVLAPNADLQGTTEIEGQVVVASISKSALGFSFALRPTFDGCVPNVA